MADRHPAQRSSRRLFDFFFYTDAYPLATTLRGLRYDARAGTSASNARIFLIQGWSTPIQMDEARVVTWNEQMCRLAFDHDAQFESWGTSPE